MTTRSMYAPAVFDTGTTFRIAARVYEDDVAGSFERHVTVTVATGACNVQTYLTPAECDELSSMLVAAAQEMRGLQSKPHAVAA